MNVCELLVNSLFRKALFDFLNKIDHVGIEDTFCRKEPTGGLLIFDGDG